MRYGFSIYFYLLQLKAEDPYEAFHNERRKLFLSNENNVEMKHARRRLDKEIAGKTQRIGIRLDMDHASMHLAADKKNKMSKITTTERGISVMCLDCSKSHLSSSPLPIWRRQQMKSEGLGLKVKKQHRVILYNEPFLKEGMIFSAFLLTSNVS